VPLLVAVKAGTLPVPLPARPMVVAGFDQVNVAPAVRLVNTEAATTVPSQMVVSAGTITIGVGFTVTV